MRSVEFPWGLFARRAQVSFVLKQIRFVSDLLRRSVLVLCGVGVYRHSCVGPVSVRVRCLFVCLFFFIDLTFVASCCVVALCVRSPRCFRLSVSLSRLFCFVCQGSNHSCNLVVCTCVCCPRRCRLSSCLSRLSVCAFCARAACFPTRTCRDDDYVTIAML